MLLDPEAGAEVVVFSEYSEGGGSVAVYEPRGGVYPNKASNFGSEEPGCLNTSFLPRTRSGNIRNVFDTETEMVFWKILRL